MGNDLITACVFCAGLLLGMDLPPPPGWGAELGAAYSAVGRRNDIGAGREDASRVIGRFEWVGLGASRAAAENLGAGTPAFEWATRVALAGSNSEQDQGTASPPGTSAGGHGRFENFALLLRVPLGVRDSVELVGNRKNHDVTERFQSGATGAVAGGERTLGADRIDVALGWRHRWTGVEGSAAALYVQADGTNGTPGSFAHSGGGVWGGALEVRFRSGGWTFVAAGQRASGSMPVREQSAPDFRERVFSSDGSLEAYRLGAGWTRGPGMFFLTGTRERLALPFVSYAVLGAETPAFQRGLHPDSRVDQWVVDLTARVNATPSLSPLLLLRWAKGSETVLLTDPTGSQPGERLDVRRSAGAPASGDLTIAIAAAVSVPWF